MGGWRPSRWLLNRRVRSDTHDQVVERLRRLGDRLGGGPRPEFRERLREDLLAAYAARHVPVHVLAAPSEEPEPEAAAPPPRRSLLVRLRPVALLLTVVVGVFLTSFHTSKAMPGDLLYPLKRAAESALLSLSTDDMDRFQRELAAARARAAEAKALVDAAVPENRDLIEKTIEDMDATTRSAFSTLARVKRPNPQSGRKLKQFAKEQRNLVEPLLPELDGDDKKKVSRYLELIERVGDRPLNVTSPSPGAG